MALPLVSLPFREVEYDRPSLNWSLGENLLLSCLFAF